MLGCRRAARTRSKYAHSMPVIALTLLTKPGCHLCDDARAVVEQVVAEERAARESDAAASSLTLIELSILDDPVLAGRYAEEIPVLLIDGAVHNIWRIDPGRLRAALAVK